MDRATKVSYLLIAGLFLLVGWLHLSTLLLTVLFSYFALQRLSFKGRKWVGVSLFLALVGGLAYGNYFFVQQAYVALPKLANETIPKVMDYAERQGIALPFSDYASLKSLAVETVTEKWANLGKYATDIAITIAAFIIGIVVAISLFLSTNVNLGEADDAVKDNLYAALGAELLNRFRTFYASFATVMGAQLLISLINTVLTAMFLLALDFKHASVIIVLTFLCGLLPVIGNLISNTLITCVALTVSPQLAMGALLFLVTIHKLEYFLNSKIIGRRIKNPMWLILLGLLLGEKLMGIPGMIIAPVVLHYIKVEASRRSLGEAGTSAGTAVAA
jgi:predicted PurR-regulated permease PerM